MSLTPKGKGFVALFDSGVGGLTVLRVLKDRFPRKAFLYLGDTARVPYGSKSRETVERYTREALNFLLQFPLKAVVVACNTASALALPALLREYPGLPLYGVIMPAVRAALRATKTGEIAVLGTESTIRSGAYERALSAQAKGLKIHSLPCPLFVPLVEEGLVKGRVAEVVIDHYLKELRNLSVDTVILGCTHYPLLRQALEEYLGEGVRIVDSAQPLAEEISPHVESAAEGETLYFTTDDPQRFSTLGTLFLGEEVVRVERIALDLTPPHLVHVVAPR